MVFDRYVHALPSTCGRVLHSIHHYDRCVGRPSLSLCPPWIPIQRSDHSCTHEYAPLQPPSSIGWRHYWNYMPGGGWDRSTVRPFMCRSSGQDAPARAGDDLLAGRGGSRWDTLLLARAPWKCTGRCSSTVRCGGGGAFLCAWYVRVTIGHCGTVLLRAWVGGHERPTRACPARAVLGRVCVCSCHCGICIPGHRRCSARARA